MANKTKQIQSKILLDFTEILLRSIQTINSNENRVSLLMRDRFEEGRGGNRVRIFSAYWENGIYAVVMQPINLQTFVRNILTTTNFISMANSLLHSSDIRFNQFLWKDQHLYGIVSHYIPTHLHR